MENRLKTPKVSVIIPTYNRARLLEEAIDSVLSQTFTGYELIVVDDGSTDDTGEVLASCEDRIRVIRQNNQGVSSARNAGIASASGDLITFLDSDDLWLPDKLIRQVEFFQQTPDALICQTEEIWIRNGIRVNPKKRHRKRSGMIFEPSLKLCLVSPSAVMIRRSLFDKVGIFDEDLPACEDYDLWLRISCRYPVYLIDEPLIVKRGGHQDQLSKAPGLDRYRIQALKKIIDSKKLSPVQYAAAVNMLAEKGSIYANGCLKRGRKKESRDVAELIGRYHPFSSTGLKP
ncbi:MAG: glycosyltransferase [Desulfobacterales bacterium]|nr:glycosyltransferase [Desulfobacterales bacterium]MDD4072887.1 glycosyltransferase [Desulfobacterales bacterium]MDD4392332.1 glycosyltransferase [Desulfobacterales bacterium]